jgi:Mn2+/Fe2+ NRAMP family transporter
MRLLLKSLGPGVITGAADDEPSGIATYPVAGAQLGTKPLLTVLLTWPLMAAVQMTWARIGMVTGQGLAGNFKQRRQAAEALRPLAGKFAVTLFTVGIVGVGFLAIPTLAGSVAYAFAETLRCRQGLDKKLKQARAFYMICASGSVRAVCLSCEPRTTISMARKVSKIIAPCDSSWPPIRGHARVR